MNSDEPITFPNDGTGDALRRVMNDGSDMRRPMKVDFHVLVQGRKNADTVAGLARERGYEVSIYGDESEGWTVECSRTMLATHDGITRVEAELDALARPHEGHADGWGTFGNMND